MSHEAAELARYEAAVWDHPRKPEEGAIAYVVRIAETVAGQPVKVRDMPKAYAPEPDVRLPYRDDSDDSGTGLSLDVDGGR